MKKTTASRKSNKAVKFGDININDGVLAAAEGDTLEQPTAEDADDDIEGEGEEPIEGGAEFTGVEDPEEEEVASEEVDISMTMSDELNAETGHTIPFEYDGKNVYITAKMLLAAMNSEAGKSAKKELSGQTKEQRKQAKENAAAARGQRFSTVSEIAEELGYTKQDLKDAGISQFINGNKANMTIVGITYASPLGFGGARYYVNHGKQMSLAEKTARIELAKRVAVAASLAAQKAGLEVMLRLAPTFGIKIAQAPAKTAKA